MTCVRLPTSLANLALSATRAALSDTILCQAPGDPLDGDL